MVNRSRRCRVATREGRKPYAFGEWKSYELAVADLFIMAALWVRDGYRVERDGNRNRIEGTPKKSGRPKILAEVVFDD